jgi:hypothetical protein
MILTRMPSTKADAHREAHLQPFFFKLVRHQLDGRVAAQGFGIGAGFVRFVHDA